MVIGQYSDVVCLSFSASVSDMNDVLASPNQSHLHLEDPDESHAQISAIYFFAMYLPYP
jgi:hypothetical protein